MCVRRSVSRGCRGIRLGCWRVSGSWPACGVPPGCPWRTARPGRRAGPRRRGRTTWSPTRRRRCPCIAALSSRRWSNRSSSSSRGIWGIVECPFHQSGAFEPTASLAPQRIRPDSGHTSCHLILNPICPPLPECSYIETAQHV